MFQNGTTQNEVLLWEALPSSGTSIPSSRKCHATATYHKSIYLFGGLDQDTALGDFYRYDLDQNKWYPIQQEGDVPEARHSHIMVILDGTLYVHGGLSQSNEVFSSIYAFDFQSNMWTRIKEVDGSLRRFGHVAVVYDGKVYIFGGHDGERAQSDIWTFDTDAKGWICLTDRTTKPQPLLYPSALVFDESLYIYGGCSNWNLAENKPVGLLGTCYEFVFETKEWRQVEIRGYAPALCGHTAIVSQDSMIVIGGDGGEMGEPSSLHDFNFVTGSWKSIPTATDDPTSAPLSRRFHCSSVYGNSLFVLFGESGYDQTMTNGVFKLNLPQSRTNLRSASMPILPSQHHLEDGKADFPTKYASAIVSSRTHSLSQPNFSPRFMPDREESPVTEICFKSHLGENLIRLVQAPRSISFSRFIELLENCLLVQSVDLHIHYKDEEDDMILVKSQAGLDEAILQAEMNGTDPIMVEIFLSKANGEPPEMIDSDFSVNFSFPPAIQISPKPSPNLTYPFIGAPGVKKTYRPKKIRKEFFKNAGSLGSSDHSKVALALDERTGNFVAVKSIDRDMITDPKIEGLLWEKIKQFSRFDCVHIVNYFGIQNESRSLDIYLEYVSGGSIQDLLLKFGPLSETIIQSYTTQILLGLEYLHSKCLPHGALRCSNVLLDNSGVVKICDYHISKALVGDGNHENDQANYIRRDIWDLGLTVLAMFLGDPNPTTGSSPTSKAPPLIPESVSPDAQDLLMRCFHQGPTGMGKPNASELLQHPFLNLRSRSLSRTRTKSMH